MTNHADPALADLGRDIHHSTVPKGRAQRQSAMQKFRKTYPRYDYFSDVAALAAIARLRQALPGKSTREVIDALVCAGAKAYFPESSGDVSGKT